MTAPQNPGDPDATDEQNLLPEAAERAVQDAAEADAAAGVDGLDPTVESDLADALADVDLSAEEADVTEEEDSLAAELAERTEDLQRVTAEYTNYRRRVERERVATIAAAKATVVSELLPILDDLALARQHGDLESGPLKSLADKLHGTLTGQGLAAFGSDGDEFDPEIHEAVQDLSTGDNKVVGTVLRQGYRMNDRVIRTAMVIIADPATPDVGEDHDTTGDA